MSEDTINSDPTNPRGAGDGASERPGGSVGDLSTMRAEQQRKRYRVGDVLLGRYRITGELGQGGMGVVFRCFDETGGIDVAVKVLPPELSHNTLEMEEVRENFRLVAGLTHQNIAAVRTLDRDETTGEYILVMECVEGVNLRRWCREQAQKGDGVSLETILPVARQAAAALDYAHARRIIHRDIKPSNIMVAPDGTVKVLDFGLAAQIHTSMTRVSQVQGGTSGTAPYMAPEQWRGRNQGAATDQYALAVTVYQLLAGHLPFESADPSVLREAVLNEPPEPLPNLDKKTWKPLATALAKAPAERYETCADFVAALGGGKAGAGGRPPTFFSRKKKVGKENRGKGGLAKAVLWLVVVGALAAAGWYGYQELSSRRNAQAQRRRREAERTKRVQAGQAYSTAKSAYEDAFAADKALLEEHGGETWREVLKQSRIGAASANDPTAGKQAYAAARKGLPAAVEEAKQRKVKSRLEAALAKAETAKKRTDWEAVLRHATVEGERPREPQARRLADKLKTLAAESDAHLHPKLTLITVIDGRETDGVTIACNDDIWASPHTFTLDKGKWYEFEVYHPTQSGKRYTSESIAVNANWTGEKSERVILRERPLPADLVETSNAHYASLRELASGSREAQTAQRNAVEKLGLPLEVRSRKTGVAFRLVPARRFTMGSPLAEDKRDDDEPQHRVTLTDAFYCGKFEVTQDQWKHVIGRSMDHQRDKADRNWPLKGVGDKNPAYYVSWSDAQDFCRKLCRMEGVPEGTYRLLTEAQWEYACRAGTETAFCYGDKLDSTMANFDGDHPYGGAPKGKLRGATVPVGQFAPNAFGLYDMHGNVWEWCSDPYDDEYSIASGVHSPGLGANRVGRGGGWNSPAEDCRSASRRRRATQSRSFFLGFRILRIEP